MGISEASIVENNIKHGSDDTVLTLLSKAKELGVPVINSCLRKELGLAMYGRRSKKVPRTACIGIVSPHGLLEEFKELLTKHQETKEKWQRLLDQNKES